jgi:hypothetical protein
MYQINSPYVDSDLLRNITWKFNGHGFRSEEYDSNKKNILIAGCSIHCCYALEDEHIFPNLLVEKLGSEYGYLNVSMPGTGIDTQIKNITWALSNYKFEKLLWLTTPPSRGIYYHESQGMLPFTPGEPEGISNKWFSSVKGRAWADARTINDYDTRCKVTDNIETLFVLLNALNIDSYVRSWGHEYDKNILSKLRQRFNIKNLPFFFAHDKAEDNIHPGIQSHIVYANQIYKLFDTVSSSL